LLRREPSKRGLRRRQRSSWGRYDAAAALAVFALRPRKLDDLRHYVGDRIRVAEQAGKVPRPDHNVGAGNTPWIDMPEQMTTDASIFVRGAAARHPPPPLRCQRRMIGAGLTYDAAHLVNHFLVCVQKTRVTALAASAIPVAPTVPLWCRCRLHKAGRQPRRRHRISLCPNPFHIGSRKPEAKAR
jgi:hypothetical protein